VYGAAGFFFVQPDERGVVRWFGRVPDSQQKPPYGVAPGLHYALPWPFCRVDQPKTTVVRRVFVGMVPEQRERIAQGDTDAMRASPKTDMFTGDVNILKVTMAVQYYVVNPVDFLLATENPDQLVRDTVQAILIDELAQLSVDAALTAARTTLEDNTRQRAQELLEQVYTSGVQLDRTTLESIEPPRAVINAFKDVVSAKKDGERAVDRAVAEANRILPRARGDAAKLLKEAEAYYVTRVRRASGEADRFLNLLAEYRRAPEVTAERLKLEAFERMLGKVRKVIVDNKPGEPPTRIRIIDQGPD
jgi:membrane protease subunit HflK